MSLSLVRFCLADAPLLYDGVMCAPESGAREQILNIAQQTLAAVHQIIAVAGAIKSPPDGYALARGDRNCLALARIVRALALRLRAFLFNAVLFCLFAGEFEPRGGLLVSDAGRSFCRRFGRRLVRFTGLPSVTGLD